MSKNMTNDFEKITKILVSKIEEGYSPIYACKRFLKIDWLANRHELMLTKEIHDAVKNRRQKVFEKYRK